MTQSNVFVVEKYNLNSCKFVPQSQEPKQGEKRFLVDKYCITSNTITYGLLERLSTESSVNYFSCFPYALQSSDSSYGILPAWGVIKDEATNDRYYGFVPFGNYSLTATKTVSKDNNRTFIDVSKKRVVLSPVYSTYNNLSYDNYMKVLEKNVNTDLLSPTEVEEAIDDYENRKIILRGLFLTSFLLYVMIDSFDSLDTIIITSASSKTSIALAYILNTSNLARKINVIGLTSRRNFRFVSNLNIYDSVYGYEDIERIKIDRSECSIGVVDICGSKDVMNTVHSQFQENIVLSSLVGNTHKEKFAKQGLKKFDNIKPEFFFAPGYFQVAKKKYGDDLESKILEFWNYFIIFSKTFLKIHKIDGRNQQNIVNVFEKVRDGKFSPADGFIVYNNGFSSKARSRL